MVQPKADFKQSFLDWKQTLDYLDEDLVYASFSVMDSLYDEILFCKKIPEDLMAEADSIASIYTGYRITTVELEKAILKLSELEELLKEHDLL